MAAAVEAVRTNFIFWQADGFHQRFDGIETQRSEPQLASDFLHHSLVFRRACSGISLEILGFLALAFCGISAIRTPTEAAI